MAVGDIVSPQISVNSNPATLQQEPPHFGIVDVEAIPLLTVLWDNLSVSALTALAALADAGLDRISTPVGATVATYVGRWVRRITDPNNTTNDPSGGTSREFDGKVVAAYGRTPLAAPGTPVEYLLVVTDDEVYIEDIASRWVVDPTR